MSDAVLRELERLAIEGDEGARLALEHARERLRPRFVFDLPTWAVEYMRDPELPRFASLHVRRSPDAEGTFTLRIGDLTSRNVGHGAIRRLELPERAPGVRPRRASGARREGLRLALAELGARP